MSTGRDVPAGGLVIAAHGRRGLIELADGSVRPCLVGSRQLQIVCGDRVLWHLPAGTDTAIVSSVETRRNALLRQPQSGRRAEPLAANLSHLAVVVAPQPAPDFFLADRYLCAAELLGCRAALVANKADLGGCDPGELGIFRALGYAVFELSGKAGTGLGALAEWFGDGIGILVGQSGVGKSSLLNALVPGAALATGRLSTGSGLGRHTTTASVMHQLPGGGRLIDTPGVRGFIPASAEPMSIQNGFREIIAAAPGCRFSDCSHVQEPGCAVQQGLAAGRIAPRRYASYCRLLAEAQRIAAGRGPLTDRS